MKLNAFKNRFASSNNANNKAKRDQWKMIAIAVAVVIIAIGFYYYSSTPTPVKKVQQPHFAGMFDGEVGANYDHARINTLLTQIAGNEHEISALKTKASEKHEDTESVDPRTEAQIAALQKTVADLRQKMNAKPPKIARGTKTATEANQSQVGKGTSTTSIKAPAAPTVPMVNSVGIDDALISYPSSHKQAERTAKNYVWAGSFANGYLLTGIIGDAGTNSTKNKGTVAIKLTTNGTMPNGQVSHLRGCVALGSSYGDLSSDSDVIHLETLSCAGKTYSFEQKVYGSVFDLDAMQDLRGIPVLKASPILGYAATAGLIAGIGDGISGAGNTSTVTGSGVVTTASSVGQSALGGAISKPADKITDYLMAIANMYHPIVVAHAGRKVTVLFQAGFWIDKAHQHYQSMRSVNAQTKPVSPITTTRTISTSQSAGLSQKVAAASGVAVTAAQHQAEGEFNQRNYQLGKGLFTPTPTTGE
jgi:conjugal transfer pilus assembly protein TraB